MLSSHKAVRPRGIRQSTSYIRISSSSTAVDGSTHRSFTWGAKHRPPTNNAGNKCKGSTTHDDAMKHAVRKQLLRSSMWANRQALQQYLPRYFSGQGLRLSISRTSKIDDWKKGDQPWGFKTQAQREEWYSRLRKEKEQRYNEFMRKVEEDPFGAVFGRRLTKWVGDLESRVNRGMSCRLQDQYPAPKDGPAMSSKHSERMASHEKAAEQRATAVRDKAQEQAVNQDHEPEYTIDPITNRKVPKKYTAPTYTFVKQSIRGEEYEIPITVFRSGTVNTVPTSGSNEHTMSRKKESENELKKDGKDWLAQEGFGPRSKSRDDCPTMTQVEDPKSTIASTRIESALDRNLRDHVSKSRDADKPNLHYNSMENKTEDVDLLRASDIRASARFRGIPAKESDKEKQLRQRRLEEEHDSRTVERQIQLNREIDTSLHGSRHTAKAEKTTLNSSIDQSTLAEHPGQAQNSATSIPGNSPSHVEPSIRAQRITARIVPLKARLDAMRAEFDALRQDLLKENRRRKSAKMHQEEINVQKTAMEAIEMRSQGVTNKTDAARTHGSDQKPTPQDSLPGEGDMASNVHEFGGRARWYKQKAPHAADAERLKLQKLEQDRNLIREIRGIYEDTYGIINTTHRQTPQATDDSLPKIKAADQARIVLGDSDSSSSFTPDSDPGTHSPPSVPSTQSHENSEALDALVLVQKLFHKLRETQKIIEDHRSEGNQDTRTSDVTSKMLELAKSYEQIIMQTAKMTSSPDKVGLGRSTGKPTDDPNIKAATPGVYRILAYDSATQKVVSSKTYSLAPFSKEQPLLPVEALEVLENPGKFLPHLMTLHNKGYSVVSGTSNILVFKKEAIGDELATARHTEALKSANPIDGTIASTGNYASPTGFVNYDPPISPEEIEEHQATLKKQADLDAQSTPSQQPPGESQAKVAEPARAPHPESSSPNSKVHRQEAVFSGRSRWQEGSGKSRKHKARGGGRRKKAFGRVLLTGTITAACCYAVGVISQMMYV